MGQEVLGRATITAAYLPWTSLAGVEQQLLNVCMWARMQVCRLHTCGGLDSVQNCKCATVQVCRCARLGALGAWRSSFGDGFWVRFVIVFSEHVCGLKSKVFFNGCMLVARRI